MASTPRQVNPAARHRCGVVTEAARTCSPTETKPVLFYYSYSILCDLRDYRGVNLAERGERT